MKKLVSVLLALAVMLPLGNANAQQFPSSLTLTPITANATEVSFKATMTPGKNILNIEAVSVAISYNPNDFSVDSLTSITSKYFQSVNWDDASVWNLDVNGVNPDLILYSEYHPSFGSVPLLKNAPPDLCVFTFYPKSSGPGTASFNVWQNTPTGALTYYFEENNPDLLNFSPVNAIQNLPWPVELTAFTAAQQGEAIALQWVTATETNNHGFHVQRMDAASAGADWETLDFVEGSGTTHDERQYLFFDWSLPHDGLYKYRLKQMDFDGRHSYSPEIAVEFRLRPGEFALRQNYPNPLSLAAAAQTTVGYDVPERSSIRLVVRNMLGQEVATLVDATMDAGSYAATWQPVDMPAGTYIVTLTAEAAASGQAAVQHMPIQVVR